MLAPSAPVAPAAGSAVAPALLSGADDRSFARLQRELGGESGVAVSAVGRGRPVSELGGMRSTIAWSTSKVPVAMAVLAAGGASRRRADLRAAITASDNAAAERLWSSLGGGARAAAAADAQLRAAGDGRTQVQAHRLRAGYTPFGQTVWRLGDQARFTAGMGCTASGRRVLALMGRTVAAQRWGLGATGAAAQLKGGWGPGRRAGVGGGYEDRQMGVLRVGGRALAVTIATAPADGTHATGTAHLTALAHWVVAHVDAAVLPEGSGC